MLKTMRFLVFIIFFCGFCIFEVNAKDYRGIGKYRFGPNVAESIACDLAFERAKKNALSNALGEHLFSQDFMRCSESDNAECELNKTIISTIDGRIKKIKKKKPTLTKQEGSSVCTYKITATIVKPKKSKDANFHFNLILNKKIFRNDEKFTIDIEPNMKMFINIFQWKKIAKITSGIILSAALFSLFHFMGDYGEEPNFSVFMMRFIAGIFLGWIYVFRGFGPAAYAHTVYDLIILTLVTTQL